MGIRDDIINIPNIVTFVRFLLGPLCFYLIFTGQNNLALFIFILGVFSDKLDGVLARNRGQDTSFGESFDPIADNSLILFTVLGLVLKNILEFYFFKYILIITLIFLLAVIINSIRLRKINIPKIVFGRINIFLLDLFIIYVFLDLPVKGLFINAVLVYSFVVSLIYLYHSIKIKRK
jgi:cardiolipin synthase